MDNRSLVEATVSASKATKTTSASLSPDQASQATATVNTAPTTATPAAPASTAGPSGASGGGGISSTNLLSPIAAAVCEQPLQGRKSALGGNGFFIEQSCTRRRSSAAAHQAKEQQRNRFLSTYVSPVRWPRASFSAGQSGSAHRQNQPLSPSSTGQGRALSRASYSAGYGPAIGFAGSASGGGALLMPTLHAPLALAGSRKTSIFDPTGHSMIPHHLITRRKSTMVTGCGGGGVASSRGGPIGAGCNSAGASSVRVTPTVVEPATAARLSSVAKSAARSVGQANRKGALAEQHVPVIGCSPTSIRASLAALDETRRYEKLLRRLERQQRRKEKRSKQHAAAHLAVGYSRGHSATGSDYDDNNDDDENEVDVNEHGDGDGDGDARPWLRRRSGQHRQLQERRDSFSDENDHKGAGSLSLRRKSLRAAVSLLNRAAGRGRSSRINRSSSSSKNNKQQAYSAGYSAHFGHAGADGLSVSSLSFLSARSSLPSLDRYEIDNDELFIDEDTMVDFGEQGASPTNGASAAAAASRQLPQSGTSDVQGSNERIGRQDANRGKRHSVRLAVKRLASSISGKLLLPQRPSRHQEHHAAHQQPEARGFTGRSMSIVPKVGGGGGGEGGQGLSYWYYYYYLRENSIDEIDDLPINANGPVSEEERRSRLYINYSLARIEILNSSGCGANPSKEAAKSQLEADFSADIRLTAAASNTNEDFQAAAQASKRSTTRDASPVSGRFDFSQSTDVSLALSTSTPTTASDSGGSASGSTESMLLDSPVRNCSSPVSSGCGRADGSKANLGGLSASQVNNNNNNNNNNADSSPSARSSLDSGGSSTVSMARSRGSQQSGASNSDNNNNNNNRLLMLSKQQHGPGGSATKLPSATSGARHSISAQSMRPSTALSLGERFSASGSDDRDRFSLSGQQQQAFRLSPVPAQRRAHGHSNRLHDGAEYYCSSTSGETNASWQQEDEEEEQQQQQQRQRLTTSPLNSHSQTPTPTPTSSQYGGGLATNTISTAGKTRRSHSNLAVAASATAAATTLTAAMSDGKRSASFACTGQRSQDDDNEEELDDFERLSRCHRGYKPPPSQQQPQQKEKDEEKEEKSSHHHYHNQARASRSELTTRASSAKSKAVSARNSNLRLSVRSVRGSSTLTRRELQNGAHSQTSLSWDTLADTANAARILAPGSSRVKPEGTMHQPIAGRQLDLLEQQQQQQQQQRQQFASGAGSSNGSVAIKQLSPLPVWGDTPLGLTRQAPERRSLRSRSNLSASGVSCPLQLQLHRQQQQQQQQQVVGSKSQLAGAERTGSGSNNSNRQQTTEIATSSAATLDQFSSSRAKQAPVGGDPDSHYCHYFDFNRSGDGQSEERPQSQEQQHYHHRAHCKSSSAPMPVAAGRARSHTSIVNLGLANNDLMAVQQDRSAGTQPDGLAFGTSGSGQQQLGFQFQLQQQQCWPATGGGNCGGQQMEAAAVAPANTPTSGGNAFVGRQQGSPRRRRTSASLRVPKWCQGGRAGSSHDISDSRQFGYPATCANLIKQQHYTGVGIASKSLLEFERSACINNNNTNNKEPLEAMPLRSEAVRFIRSNEAARSNSSAQVEVRLRAFSTGNGSMAGLGVRRASSYARDENFRNQQQQGQLVNQDRTQVVMAIGASDDFQHRTKREIQGIRDHLHLDQTVSGNQQPQQQQAPQNLQPSQQTRQQTQSKQPDLDLSATNQSDMQLLGKKSFTCMLVGARQSGKQTIVKCFVKLLNEFKLAADEYRRERMLTKLMDCSERLQEITNQHEADEADQSRRTSVHQQYRSRMNSWLGSGTVNKLLNFPSVGKLRLNSVAGRQASNGLQFIASQQQRRHTAVVQSFHLSARNSEQSSPCKSAVGRHDSRENIQSFLYVPSKLNPCNRSDFNINYRDNSDGAYINNNNNNNGNGGGVGTQCEPSATTSAIATNRSNQLQVPGSSSSGANIEAFACEPASNSGGLAAPSIRRSVQLLAPTASDECRDESEPQAITTTQPRRREHSIQISAPRKRPLLSLKEINRRRVKIRFKTRRQLSERYLASGPTLMGRPGNTKNKSANDGDNSKQQQQRPNSRRENKGRSNDLPDSFVVVYSINDRDSFDYAKSLISQLRSIELDTQLPIVLVANKIDLERAKEVKSEEGRSLARGNACKFMEISCTVGFNLDNLLVGIRTQLILKHHTTLNSILRRGKSPTKATNDHHQHQTGGKGADQGRKHATNKPKGGDNILVRFYKRYMVDNCEQPYDCDNFSKL